MIVLRSESSISRPCNAQEMTKSNIGPNIPKSTCAELKHGIWLRKAANVKEENFMAFQGKED